MARPEPFRTLLEEARLSEPSLPPVQTVKAAPAQVTRAPAPEQDKRLEKRLDQVTLAGVTPPRGLRPPRSAGAPPAPPVPRDAVPLRLAPLPPPPPPVVLAPEPARSQSTSSLLDELEAFTADATRQLDRPAAVDAALQDALAAAEATREIPAQRNMPARPATVTGISALPSPTVSMSSVQTQVVPKLALLPEVAEEVERNKPPPLPKREKKPVVAKAAKVATVAPPPVLTQPPPKMVQVLGDELTIPGLSPVSSGSGKVISQTDLYRLQLEFEDTPARPLPALASLVPLPVLTPIHAVTSAPALIEPARLAGVESTDLNKLHELEGIEDLDALAQAMGLKSLHEVSIPEDEPVGDDDVLDDHLDAAPRMTSDVRRARVHAALGDGREDVFLDDERTIEGLPVIVSRPPLRPEGPAKAATPVIVKIPARPKVSAEARSQARKLYLAAVDELAKGDKVGAIGHLKLAIHYDDGVPLYQDFLKQLTKGLEEQPQQPRRRRIDAANVRR